MELTITQIAARLGISERTAQRWIANGKLQVQKIAHHRYQVEEKNLNALIVPQSIESQTQFAALRLEIRNMVLHEIENLKQRMNKLEQRIDSLEQGFNNT